MLCNVLWESCVLVWCWCATGWLVPWSAEWARVDIFMTRVLGWQMTAMSSLAASHTAGSGASSSCDPDRVAAGAPGVEGERENTDEQRSADSARGRSRGT